MISEGFEKLSGDISGNLERLGDRPSLSYKARQVIRGGEELPFGKSLYAEAYHGSYPEEVLVM